MIAHYCDQVEGGFWFRNAYAQLLEALPPDQPAHWVEVGVFHGQSLAWLGVEIANRGLPVTIHAVDHFAGWPGVAQGEVLRQSFERTMAPLRPHLNGRLRVHPTHSLAAVEDFADASCDVVWLDADHTYEAVTADIRAWWPKVKPGGVLGGDDWAWNGHGVERAVRDAFGDRAEVGIGQQGAEPWPWWMVRKPC